MCMATVDVAGSQYDRRTVAVDGNGWGVGRLPCEIQNVVFQS